MKKPRLPEDYSRNSWTQNVFMENVWCAIIFAAMLFIMLITFMWAIGAFEDCSQYTTEAARRVCEGK